jgi:hypothetical protein
MLETAMHMDRAAQMSVVQRAGRLIPVAFALWVLGVPKSFGADAQLLSLSGVQPHPLRQGEDKKAQYIAAFDIKTWAVKVLAVCHIPAGWTISAGKNAYPEGVLSGSAGEGVAFIDAAALAELNNLFLVQVTDYHAEDRGDCARDCTPATFSGDLYIGTYGASGVPDTKLRLSPANIRLTSAAKCPDPY